MKKLSYFMSLFFWLFLGSLICQSQDEPQIPKGQLLPVENIKRSKSINQIPDNKSVTTIFTDDFESGYSNWDLSGSWQEGAPIEGTSNENSSSKCIANTPDSTYLNDANDWMISSSIYLPDNVSQILLKFNEWFELESGYDEGLVKLFNPSDSSWVQIDSRDGLSDWRERVLDITTYKGNEIKLAFNLTSDSSIVNNGWYVDDVMVEIIEAEPLEVTMQMLNSQNFPLIYMNVGVSTYGVGIPDLNQSNFNVYENGVLQTDLFDVTPPTAGGGQRLADIVFLVDNSGSMSGEQQAIRNNLISFIDQLLLTDIDYALGLCRFGQGANGGNPIIEDNGILTQNALYYRDNVWLRNTIDGGHEPGYYAITQSSSGFNFRPGAQKIFVILTDETPNQGGATQQQAIDACLNNAIRVYAMTNGSSSALNQVATATNGQYYNITDPFNQILNEIGTSISDNYVVRYRSDDDACNGVQRNVEVVVSNDGLQESVFGSYMPCQAPSIVRTQASIDLHNQAWAENTQFTIEVIVTDDFTPYVNNVRLYYKNTSQSSSNYQSIAMINTGGNSWSASIPTNAVTTPGLDYYITATDGTVTVSDPPVDPTLYPFQFGILPNAAPSIVHTPLEYFNLGQEIEITADIIDNTNMLDIVSLFYRERGQILFQSVAMLLVSGNEFQAIIPSNFAVQVGVDYYISAWDNFGVRTDHGSHAYPHSIDLPNGKISLTDILVQQMNDVDFIPYTPDDVIGILVNDKVRFKGLVTDDQGYPLSNIQVQVYSSIDYDPENSNNGLSNITTNENGVFYFPNQNDYIEMNNYAGVYPFWFALNSDLAIPFLMLLSDQSNTTDYINEKLRANLPNETVLDMKYELLDDSDFQDMILPFIPYPPFPDDLNSNINDSFWATFVTCYIGPTDFNFLLSSDFNNGWLASGLNIYNQKVGLILEDLPERYQSSIPLSVNTKDYNPTKKNNLIWYGIEGLVCLSTLIPTGVTQVVGPIGCAALKVHIAKDAIKTVVTNDNVQQLVGAEGNDEIDLGLELIVDIGGILVSPPHAHQHLGYWHNPRNLANGGQFLGTNIHNGRVVASVMLLDDFHTIGEVGYNSYNLGNAIGNNYQNSQQQYKGTLYENINYTFPAGNYTTSNLNFAFTRSFQPDLNFDYFNSSNGMVSIDITSSRPLFQEGTTTEIIPDILIDYQIPVPMNITSPFGNEVRRYSAEIPWSVIPDFDPQNPNDWNGSLSVQANNFETRFGTCVGNQCGIGNYYFVVPNINQQKNQTYTSYAELFIQDSTFVNQSSLVTLSVTTFLTNTSQSFLDPCSYAFKFSSSESSFYKPIKLIIHYDTSINIPNNSDLGLFKMTETGDWIEISSILDTINHLLINENTEIGTYVVAYSNITLPQINIVPETTLNFGNVPVGQCEFLTYQLSGINLISDVNIKTTDGFQVSANQNSGYDSLIIVQQNNGIIDQNIYIRFCPTSLNTYNGDLIHSSPGCDNKIIALTGYGDNSIMFDLQVFLEGPFDGIGMTTTLNDLFQLPLDQPYNIPPWNYAGTESVTAIPNTNIVDWILVELRETPGDVTSATAETMIAQQAGFLLSNGYVVGLDGLSLLTFDVEINDNIFVVIRHRNHLDIISANPVTYSSGVYTYNFASNGNIYGDWNGHKELVPGIYGMITGDGVSDGVINDADKSPLWDLSSGKTGYMPSDYNMDGEINNIDKDFYWFINIGRFSQVPGDVFSCGQPILDQRDGQSYNTVLIGNQCWMAENLNIGDQIDGNVEQSNNAIIEKYCYSNNLVNCENMGGLYQWNEVMEYQTDASVQGICPDGWHVPTSAEYKVLEGNTDSQYPVGDPEWDNFVWRGFDVGLNLKSTSGWELNGSGLDTYGFTAMASGYRIFDGSFKKLGYEANFWTSDVETAGKAWIRRFDCYEEKSKNWYFQKIEGRSVRCLKD